MMYLNGFIFADRNLSQHYKNVDGFYKNGEKFCDLNAVRINNYVIPRATLHFDYELLWGYEFTNLFYCVADEIEHNTECARCEFAEDCNGQLCMFAMM